MPVRAGLLLAALVATLVPALPASADPGTAPTGASTRAAAAVPSPLAAGATTAGGPTAAAGAPVAFAGGDVVPVVPAASLGQAVRTTTWATVPVAGSAAVPTGGAQAVVLAVHASASTAAGRVLVRPRGGTATSTVPFGAGKSVSSTVVVQLGPAGDLQVSATAGQPTVRLEVVAWVPVTAAVVVPATAVAAVSAAVKTVTVPLQLGGRAGVPASTSALWVQVTVAPTAPGTLVMWTPGTPEPAVGTPAAAATWTTLVRPDANGRLSVRMKQGAANLTVRVIGWSLPSATLAAPAAPAALPNLAGPAVQTVTLAGVGPLPAAPGVVALRASGRDGARLDVWRDTATGAPTQSVRLSAAGTVLAVPVGPSGKVQAKVTAAPGDTTTSALGVRLAVLGWSSDAAGQQVSWTPKAGTVLLGASDVISITRTSSGGSAVLEKASARPVVGGALVLRPRDGTGPLLGRVSAVSTEADGQLTVTLAYEELALADAFTDFTAHYAGPLSPQTATAAPSSGDTSRRGAAGINPMPGISLPVSDSISCGAGVSPADIVSLGLTYDGDAQFDVDLASRSLEVAVKGAIRLEARLRTSVSVSCTVSNTDAVYVPLGALPVGLQLGASGTLSLSPESEGHAAGTTLAISQRVYASYAYYDGESIPGQAAGFDGSITPQDERLSASLDLGLSVAVVPVSVRIVKGWSASASVTAGLSFRIGPPTGTRSWAWFGPRCVVAGVGAFVGIGAGVTGRWFPDVHVDIARWESPQAELYRGSCYGYTGTVTHRITGTNIVNSISTHTHNSTITRTLIPGPAMWGKGTGLLQQPYTWTGRMSNSYRSSWFDGVQQQNRSDVTDVSGSGTFMPSDTAEPWVLDAPPASGRASTAANFPDSYRLGTVTRSGYGPPTDGTYEYGDTIGWPSISISLPQGGTPLRERSQIELSGFEYWTQEGGVRQDVTISLTRNEYPIPPGEGAAP